MKIYTKQGDAGETGLYGGARVPKDDLRIRAYGTLDELNAALGLVLAEKRLDASLRPKLTRLQGALFQLGAELSTPRGRKLSVDGIGDAETAELEREIDAMEAELEPLKNFILPGGGPAAAALHLARTVSRRAEREAVSLNRAEPLRAEVMRFLNRLSDYFFVCARYANHKSGIADVPWVPTGKAPRKR